MRRTIGATIRTAGNAISQEDSHARGQAEINSVKLPTVRKIASPDTINDIMPDNNSPKA